MTTEQTSECLSAHRRRSSWAQLSAAQDEKAAHTHVHTHTFSRSPPSVHLTHLVCASFQTLPSLHGGIRIVKTLPLQNTYRHLTHGHTSGKKGCAEAYCSMHDGTHKEPTGALKSQEQRENRGGIHRTSASCALCLSCRSDSSGTLNCIKPAYSVFFIFQDI